MRRKLLLMLCAVLALASIFGGTALAADSDYTYIRVKLSIGTPTSFSFYVDGNYDANGTPLERQLYTVKVEGGTLNLYLGATLKSTGNPIRLTQHEGTAGRNNIIYLNTSAGYNPYTGDMNFIIQDGAISAINHVYIDDYLCGVLPHEMSESFPLEALKAQAVAARTYVTNYKNTSPTSTSDVVDTSTNQVFRGYNTKNVKSFQAVAETARQILKYDGNPIQCFFSASNGGYTDIPQHRWSITKKLPYQVIQPDPFDVDNPSSPSETLTLPKTVTDTDRISYKNYTGTADTFQSANADKYLKTAALPAVAAQGYIGVISDDISIVGVNSIVPKTYRGQHYVAFDEAGNVSEGGSNPCPNFTQADVTMTVAAKKYVAGPSDMKYGDVNGDGVISISDYTLIRLHILGLRTLTDRALTAADANRDGNISISDYTMARLDILGLKPIDQSNTNVVTENITVTFTINFDTMMADPYKTFTNTSLGLFTVSDIGTGWTIYHGRYGHAIGLSQRGAQQRANSGQSYIDILSFYYPNTAREELAISKPALTPMTIPADQTNATVNPAEPYQRVWNAPGGGTEIGRLPSSGRFQVTQANVAQGWHAINYGGTTGYVPASYVTLD